MPADPVTTSPAAVATGSFRIDQEVEIAAPREKAWASLLDVDGWWCHRIQKSGSTLVLEPQVGGRFYERWTGDEGALWGIVTYLRRPEILRLSGPLGTERLATSLYEFRLEAKGEKTLLRLTHRCIGEVGEMRGDYEGGWQSLWKHLRALAETGARFSR